MSESGEMYITGSVSQVAGMKKKRNFDKADTNLEHSFETFLK